MKRFVVVPRVSTTLLPKGLSTPSTTAVVATPTLCRHQQCRSVGGGGVQRLPLPSALDWFRQTCTMLQGEEGTRSAASPRTSPTTISTPPAPLNREVAPKVDLDKVRKELLSFVKTSNALPEELCVSLWEMYGSCTTMEERLRFVKVLAKLSIDRTTATSLLQSATKSLTVEAEVNAEAELCAKQLNQLEAIRGALTPIYTRWFRQSQTIAGGMKLLLEMRASLLRLDSWAKKHNGCAATDHRAVSAILSALTHELRDWFHVAWLATARLSWDKTPPSVIENVIQHETVHPFKDLASAKHRMAPADRRQMFAFYHPTIPYEPLVTVQVALCCNIASSVDEILWQERGGQQPSLDPKKKPDTAIFYSINATQDGLKGIELGKFLIQQVVARFQRRDEGIVQFSTLSPIPRFMSWVKSLVSSNDAARGFSASHLNADVETLSSTLSRHFDCAIEATPRGALDGLHRLCVTCCGETEWWRDASLVADLEGPVMRCVAHYLLYEKRRAKIFDPVGNFHVKNGAELFRINWDANRTIMGSKQSACVMVNYRYDLQRMDANAKEYDTHNVVAIGDPVKALLQ